MVRYSRIPIHSTRNVKLLARRYYYNIKFFSIFTISTYIKLTILQYRRQNNRIRQNKYVDASTRESHTNTKGFYFQSTQFVDFGNLYCLRPEALLTYSSCFVVNPFDTRHFAAVSSPLTELSHATRRLIRTMCKNDKHFYCKFNRINKLNNSKII